MSVFFWEPRKKWVVQWQEDGKRRRKYFATDQEARCFEDDRVQPQRDTRLTLGELATLYFRSNPDKHIKTRKNVMYFLAGHERDGKQHEGAGEFLFDIYASALTRTDLERMRESLRVRGTGNSTINKYQTYIRAILAWGVDQQLIEINPWRDYKRLPHRKPEITTTLDDFRAILAYCPEWLRWAFATAYALAMRPGHVELFSLTWSSFNWKFGYVQYRQGKSGRIKRVVPPPTYFIAAKQRFADDTKSGIPWVCHRAGRKVLDYNTAWRKAVKDAGMSGRKIRPYDIRHVAASEMLAAGVDLASVAAQLGHASTQTTATTYSHVIPGGQQNAAEKLPPLEE